MVITESPFVAKSCVSFLRRVSVSVSVPAGPAGVETDELQKQIEVNLALQDKLERIEWRLGKNWETVVAEFELNHEGVSPTLADAIPYLQDKVDVLEAEIAKLTSKEEAIGAVFDV